MSETKSAPNADASNSDAADQSQKFMENYQEMATYLGEIGVQSQSLLREYFERAGTSGNIQPGNSDPLNIGDSFQEVLKGLSADPATVFQAQLSLWADFATMMATMTKRAAGEEVEPVITPDKHDRRFMHPAWSENHFLDFTKQSYLIVARWLEKTISNVQGLDEHDKAKAIFYSKQFIDACSPTNFAMLNPEVVEETVHSKGENLLRGLRNLLEDIERGHGDLAIRQADLDYFELGKNIATTEGSVVFQNEIMQLIQYAPKTERVAKTPMLICPPWINKFYILDLQPKNSFIKWLVEQGRTVFVISWVNPTPAMKDTTFQDHIEKGLFEALGAIEKATGESKVDTIGYCIGGTMLATALSLMAKTGDERVNSATFFTAQADFSEAGELSLFIDDEQLSALQRQMEQAGGVLTGQAMSTTFNMLRSNDLIWSFVIDNYLKGKDPAKFDLLYWNSDATRMAMGVHMFYLREFYGKNLLSKGGMVMNGHTLDLGEVNVPIFMQAGETDHIAPFRSVYKTAKLFGGPTQFMLAGSGHIAGVINHPDKNKYHHSINTALPDTVDEWRDDAKTHKGSWWPYWMRWLDEVSTDIVDARKPGDGALPVIEAAPGSYVREKA